MATFQISVKELKKLYPVGVVPVLLFKEGETAPFSCSREDIQILEDSVTLTLPCSIEEDTDTKYLNKIEELYHANIWGEDSQELEAELARLESVGFDDFDYVMNYIAQIPYYTYYNKFDKKEVEAEKVEAKIYTDDMLVTIPSEIMESEFLWGKKPEQKEVVKEIPKEEAKSETSPIPQIKNDGSTRDAIITKSYRGMENKGNEVCWREDILGRWWDIKALKDFIGGEILIDGLVTEGYPPYIANADKEEVELIKKTFLEKKGRKPFE